MRSRMQRSGQTSLLLSFSSKSRVSDEDRATVSSNKPSVSFSEYLNRKVTKTSSRSVKEKKTCFATIVPANDDLTSKRVGDCESFVLHDQIFHQFKVSEKKEEPGEIAELGETMDYQPEPAFGGGEVSRKRKNTLDDPSGSSMKKTARKSLVVIGDDSKPWLYGREKKIMGKSTKHLYDHYANGSGWWDCNREGIDSEEVGCNETWEGIGSTTLGGLEWH
ncbi:uncharacterized protein LOC121987534 [Zingiber officinale]|uniref:Uncharacterized protein n=1 Tax=Zingiber officinale TaxID=94328 RepID=A0A8J5GFH4_ZINOF|nr:uncharacterized protein LOC121987534 [Zingiber officinale]KAG6503684.1 hypothetical protein ZIOFF_036008 [Zingiber officinale]